jgi:hypothetical protein
MVCYLCAAFYSRLGVKDKFAFLNTMAAERIIRSFFYAQKNILQNVCFLK